ncbi:MAG TPA: methyltransferase domain-containing protein, partial [Fimbriimonas sp.]|nr:methyltransferase domain-containing protein [Fimbriimonas sp.]
MTQSSDSFTKVAEFYDELMKPVPYRMWVSYYLLLLAMQGIKPKTMLDMCCGTGTMTELMFREGFEVDGFDLSADMIEVARKKAERKKMPLRYEVQDATQLDMQKTYDACFSFFDSFNNITDPAQFRQALESAYRHLQPGGSFIFDLNTAYAFQAKLFNQQDLRKDTKVRYRWRGEWDKQTRLITVNMKFWVGDAVIEELHIQRAYELDEVVDMLLDIGFEDVRFFHSYTLQPPGSKSDRI